MIWWCMYARSLCLCCSALDWACTLGHVELAAFLLKVGTFIQNIASSFKNEDETCTIYVYYVYIHIQRT